MVSFRVGVADQIIKEGCGYISEAGSRQFGVHDALEAGRGVGEAVVHASVAPELVAQPKGGVVLVVGVDGNLMEGPT